MERGSKLGAGMKGNNYEVMCGADMYNYVRNLQ